MANDARIVLSAVDNTGAAFRSTEAGLKRVEGVAASLGLSLGALGAGITLGAVIGSLKSAADAMDRLNDAADATGASVESLSKLENVARRNGASIELVEGAVLRMNKALTATDEEGSAAAGVLKTLGLNAAELKRLDPAEALQQVARAFQTVGNAGDRARAIQILFGRSVAEVAPFLKDLAESGKLNATVTTQQAEEAEKFNKQLFALSANVGDAARSLVGTLVPALNSVLDTLNKNIAATGSFSSGLRESLLAAFNPGTAAGIKKEIEKIDAELASIRDKKANPYNPFADFIDVVGNPSGILQSRKAALTAQLREIEALTRTAGAQISLNLQSIDLDKFLSAPAVQSDAGRKLAEQSRMLNEYAQAVRGFAQESPQFKQAMAALNQGLANIDKKFSRKNLDTSGLDALRDSLEATIRLAKEVDRELERLADARETQFQDLIKAKEDELDAQQRINDQLEDLAQKYRDLADPMAVYRRQLAEIDKLELEGRLNAEAASGARARVSLELQESAGALNDELVKQNDIGRELGLTFTSAFEDAIIEGENFRDVLQSIGKDIARIVLRKGFTEPLGNAVASIFTGNTSSGSGGSSGIGSSVGTNLAGQGISSAFGGTAGIVSGISSLAAGTTLGSFGAGFAGGLSSFGSLSATTASIGAAGTGTAAGFGYALGAIAPYLAAIVAVASLFMGESTPHAGATVFGSEGLTQTPKTLAEIDKLLGNPSGARSPYSGPGLFYETDFTKRFSSDVAEALDPLALNLAETFNKITRASGLGGGFRVGLGFSADDDDKSRGRFAILDAAGKEIETFRKRFASDPGKGLEQFGLAAQQGLLAGLRELDLGAKVNAVLDKSLSDSGDALYKLTQDQTTALLSLMEGGLLDDLVENLDLAKVGWDDINNRIEQFAKIIDLKPLFDAVGVSIANFGVDLTNALGGAENAAATLQGVLDFRNLQSSAANLFAGSIRNIQFGQLDDPGKYEFLDKEAARFRDVLASLSDANLIQEYAGKLNETIVNAFGLLSQDEQALRAGEFIKTLESASQLTQDRLAVAQDKQFAAFDRLPDAVAGAIDKAMAKYTDLIAAAVKQGVSIDLRLAAGLEVGI